MENSNKLIVVTGGTKGIGKAIITSFSRLGYSIATCSRSEEDLKALKQEIEEEHGNKLHCFQADLSIKEETQAFLEFILLIGKSIEVLVNNTGKYTPGEIHLEDEGILEDLIETNVYSAYRMTRGLVPAMKKNKRGHVFNICSIASFTAYKNGGAYCISKFALYGMSKVLREEMKEFGVRVTSVMPGATFTSSWEGVELPPERFAKPEDVAEMVLATYQLSPQAVVEDLVIRPQLGDI